MARINQTDVKMQAAQVDGMRRVARKMRLVVSSCVRTLLVVAVFMAVPTEAVRNETVAGETRIKDIARFVGLDEMELIGYGLVAGLGGTGDRDLTLTQQTVSNLLNQFQITVPLDDISGENVAAVMVMARVQPFHHSGDRVDVSVLSMGDATSLNGGTLLMTPLLAPDGRVYALAQGALVVGGFSVGVDAPGGHQLTRNTPTSGQVPSGAVVRHDDRSDWDREGLLTLSLRHPDFTTATRVAAALNRRWPGLAGARDAATVHVRVPEERHRMGDTARFVSELENVRVVTDMRARLLINERTGTIVIGGDIHVHPAVVAHGNLTVSIKSSLAVSQPPMFSSGETVVVEDVETMFEEDRASVMLVPELITVQELAETLNQIGGSAQDLISILQSLRRLGAIQVEIETM